MRNFDELHKPGDSAPGESATDVGATRAEEASAQASGHVSIMRSPDLRSRWNEIQARFVDDPRDAVGQADEMVGSAIERLTALAGENRSRLKETWDSDRDVSTENLRVAIQSYRKLFDQLSILEKTLMESR